ncbi:hypothetical protein AVEN_193850-1 [Araneus ventricosus]|uniref:Histone-lysine N-methyltransferase SETMAR n=1 Tax=Araneus ventricosus TaxID=182803 RepID=A0A4Y2I0T2_ARAVE|nr:hypothetical protein AVEN_193850-1 [Araneus ventricosus]
MHGRLQAVPRHHRSAVLRVRSPCVETSENRCGCVGVIRTRELLDGFGWELFGHPPYSPDLAPSDFHLLLHMKTWLATQHFGDDEELSAGVRAWLKSQVAKFYDDGIKKLVYRYDKCLNLNGHYVEK